MRLVACVWFPRWLLQCRRVLRLPLAEVVVAEGKQAAVVESSLRARRLGIRPGLAREEALALARQHSLQVAPYRPEEPLQAQLQVARWLQGLGVGMGRSPYRGNDAVFLELPRGLSPVQQHRLGVQAIRCLNRRGLRAQVGVASTPGAAWAAACFAPRGKTLQVVPPERLLEFLRPLPLQSLGLPEQDQQALQSLWYARAGEVLALLPHQRGCVLSPQGQARLDQLLGRKEELLEPLEPPLAPQRRLAFPWPVENWEGLVPGLRKLLHELIEELKTKHLGISVLQLLLFLSGGEQLKVCVACAQPCQEVEFLLELLRLRLEQKRLGGPVEAVRASVVCAGRIEWQEPTLFPQPGRRSELDLLWQRLAARLGFRQVCLAVPCDHWEPEGMFRLVPLLGKREGKRQSETVPASWVGAPWHLVHPPRPLAVVAGFPNGRPERLWWRGEMLAVVRCWGPFRLQGLWWSQTPQQRDYFRVESRTGEHFLVFCQLDTGQWFLHGMFS